MSKVPPKRKGKGDPPKPEKATQTGNLEKGGNQELKPMNFKVPAEFRKEFRTYASELDISMVELLRRCFDAYKSK